MLQVTTWFLPNTLINMLQILQVHNSLHFLCYWVYEVILKLTNSLSQCVLL